MAEFTIGQQLPDLVLPALSRQVLALYCGGSGDHHPLHVDSDYARDVAGLPDVIGHGMLTMAYLGRLVTDHWPQHRIRSLETRFGAPTHVGDVIVCRGTVEGRVEFGGRECLAVSLQALVGNRKVATGRALVSVDG